MASAGVRAAPDPASRTEVLSEDARTRVIRVATNGRTVISKEPLGPDADRRVRHETAVLALLGTRQRWQRMHRTGQADLALTTRANTDLSRATRPDLGRDARGVCRWPLAHRHTPTAEDSAVPQESVGSGSRYSQFTVAPPTRT